MCQFVTSPRCHAEWRWRTLIPSIVLLTALFGVAPASAQVVAQYDFETGTQGWTPFFGATVALRRPPLNQGRKVF
jgi:hypothetical protein